MITVYQSKGSDNRCCYADIETERKIIESSVVEADKRMRVGVEMEKSVFLEQYKDRPEVIRKAKFFPVRIRDDSGKWVLEQHVKIYDEQKGIYRFEESHTQEVRRTSTVDNCAFEFGPDHQQRVFEDHAAATFRNSSGSGSSKITAEDVGMKPTQHVCAEPQPSRTGSVAGKSKKPDTKDDSDSEEELSPLEKSMVSAENSLKKQKKTAAAKSAAKRVGSSGSGGGGVMLGGAKAKADQVTAQLLDEVDRGLQTFKGLQKLDAGSQESLSSLASRLQAKRTALSKKASRDKSGESLSTIDTVTMTKGRVAALVELVKAILTFEKKRIRKNATCVEEKFDEMRSNGVTLDMLPTCVAAVAVHSTVCILTADGKYQDCTSMIDPVKLREHAPDANQDEVLKIQKSICVKVVSEFVRHLVESKEATTQAAAKVQQLCGAFAVHALGSVSVLMKAIMTLLNDSTRAEIEVVEATNIVLDLVICCVECFTSRRVLT